MRTAQSHLKGIDNIVNRLLKDDMWKEDIETNHLYCVGDQTFETDVLLHDSDRLVIFEYKSKDSPTRRHKAERQLTIAKQYYSQFFPSDRIAKFYVHDNMIYEWLK